MMRPSSLQDCDPLIVALTKKHPKVCYTFTKTINHLQLRASDYLNISLSMIFNIPGILCNISELFCPRVWSKIGMTGQHIFFYIMYMINIVFNELKDDLSKLKSKL